MKMTNTILFVKMPGEKKVFSFKKHKYWVGGSIDQLIQNKGLTFVLLNMII